MVKKEKATSHFWTWIKVVAAFLAGLVIGELKIGRRRSREGVEMDILLWMVYTPCNR